MLEFLEALLFSGVASIFSKGGTGGGALLFRGGGGGGGDKLPFVHSIHILNVIFVWRDPGPPWICGGGGARAPTTPRSYAPAYESLSTVWGHETPRMLHGVEWTA